MKNKSLLAATTTGKGQVPSAITEVEKGKRDPSTIAKAEDKGLTQNVILFNRLADPLNMELLEL